MSLKNKFLSLSYLLALPLLLSCQGIVFNPDWHVGDSALMAIVPESGPIVHADEPYFNEFACMHKSKVSELKEILLKARMPRNDKLMLLRKSPTFR